MSANDVIQLVFDRNQFYRRQFFLVFGAFLLTIVINVVLICSIVVVYTHPRLPLFFPTDKVGRLVSVTPIAQPNMTLDEIKDWGVEAVQSAFSFDYMNYRTQLQNAQKYFTNSGWMTYMRALTLSNNLLAVKTRQQLATATVVATPQLISSGVLNGAAAWKIRMPLLVTYISPPYDNNSRYSNALTVTIIIQRQEILSSYKGLAIVQMVTEVAATPVQNQDMTAVAGG